MAGDTTSLYELYISETEKWNRGHSCSILHLQNKWLM